MLKSNFSDFVKLQSVICNLFSIAGTYQIKKSDKVKHYVAQNIRNFSNEELVRKIQGHLRGLNFDEEKIPGRTYMLKILRSLPAKKAKQMKGLCDIVDDGEFKIFYILVLLSEVFYNLEKNDHHCFLLCRNESIPKIVRCCQRNGK